MNNLTKIIFLIFAVFIVIVSAKAEVLGSSMKLAKTMYGAGESVQGIVNLSLSKEPVSSPVSALGMNITILEFLEKNGLESEKDFYCNPIDCQEYYEPVGSSVKQKAISGSMTIGGMIVGKDIEIKADALEFSIEGKDSAEICGSSPLRIDFLDNSSTEWIYIEPAGLCGSLNPSSCYDDSVATSELDITTSPYCQKIFMPLSGRFKLSALAKKNKGGGDLTAFIYEKNSGSQFECDLPEPNLGSYVEVSCMVDMNAYRSNMDYYVCIRDNLLDNAYTIKAETQEPKCGYTDLPGLTRNASADFALLVQETAIAPLNRTIRFDETEFSKFNTQSISDYLQDYLKKRYNNDCTEGCLVPVNLISQNGITIKNFKLSYCAQGLCTTDQNFFELKRKSATVDVNATGLNLDVANFSTYEYGTKMFKLSIGEKNIGEQEISIEKVPIIKNLITPPIEAGAEITFLVEAYSPKNNSILNYGWDFGDGSTATTNVDYANHTYSTVGKFYVAISATDSEGLKGTRKFEIMVGSPVDILNRTLKEKRIVLEMLKSEVAKSGWSRQLIEKQLGLAEKDVLLESYENEFKFASTDSELIDLITKVDELVLPKSLQDFEFVTEMPIAVDVNSIKPELIESLDGGLYDPDLAQDARNAIWDWQNRKIKMTATARITGAIDENDNKEYVATIINLRIKPLDILDKVYLLILAPYGDAAFAADYGQKNAVENIGFELDDFSSDTTISFALAGKVDLINLVVFASPPLSELEIGEEISCNSNRICEKDLGETWRNCRQDCKPVGMAVFFLVVVIALMASAYLMLQKWYKNKYERYLFKNANDLHNLISFAGAAFRKGDDKEEIRKKLKQARWGSEQIDYAMKKIKGEKIGMPEVKLKSNLFKLPNFFKHRKV